VSKDNIFYVRIDIVDLMDFATDPDGENMSLLTFAKELKKGESDYPKIQRFINEAHCYIKQKKSAGKESAKKRAEKAKKEKEEAEKARLEKVNGVATEVNGVATEVNGPSTNNRSSSITTELHLTKEEQTILYPGRVWVDENGVVTDFNTGENANPF